MVGDKMNLVTEQAKISHDPHTLFNYYLGANVLYAYHQIGLFDIVKPNQTVSVADIAFQTGSEIMRLKALLRVGEVLGYLNHYQDDSIQLSLLGEEMRKHIGYIIWSVGAYGDMLSRLGDLHTGVQGWSGLRDEGKVALGSDLMNSSILENLLSEVLDSFPFQSICDFGCGNGSKLINMLKRYPERKGVGIDISTAAIGLARQNVKHHDLSDRVTLLHANILDMNVSHNDIEVLGEVEVVTSFMMMHDLFNITEIRETLFDRLRNVFPKVKYFLISDTLQTPIPYLKEKLPIFNVGFELVHAYMDVYIPTKEEYDLAFQKAGLTIERCIPFGPTSTYLYVLKV
ncbi:methyltransferase domain-containing protein [Brevibacillus laterosporus]|nr:methyltransferase domain-containing protein [Brevibacillus laterosporus]TPG75978.1 methyltransferase domain-containing protein [Brevibacillus laterosporus]